MKDIIVKVTNFVNENTMLLIGICAFLILVLIIYLVDNSVKTKKMQKALKEMDTVEDKVVDNKIDENNQKDAEVNINIKNDEEPKYDSISLNNDEEIKTPAIEESTSEVEPVSEEPEENIDINTLLNETPETPEVKEEVSNVPEANSKFTNKKSLSEILSKKKEPINKNDADKTLEETTEFNNTF